MNHEHLELFRSINKLTSKGKIPIGARIVVENCLKQILPDDASISGDWHFQFKDNCVVAYSAFECVDSSGDNDGWLPFAIHINPDLSFFLHFRGSQSKYVEVAKICIERIVGESFEEARAQLWAFSLLNDHPRILAEMLEKDMKLN